MKIPFALMLTAASSAVWANGEVTEAVVSTAATSPVSYLQDGVLYRFGEEADSILDGFVYQNESFVFDSEAVDTVSVKRVDNDNAVGTRCAFYAEPVSDQLVYSPGFPGDASVGNCSVEQMVADGVINVNPLDVFTNAGSRPDSYNNIERIDFVTNNGISTGADVQHLDFAGAVITEKAGNNQIKVAAILSLDADGTPSSYGKLVLVDRSTGSASNIRYGISDIKTPFHYLSNSNGVDSGNPVFRSAATESLGIAFISQQDLGLTTNQTYFGFSIFAADVNSASHDLTDPATFPRDTAPDNLGPGDADFSAASAFLVGNNAPVANDDSATTLVSQPVTIDVLENDRDPDGDTLVVTIINQPQNGTVEIVNNELVYVPDAGFTGTDSITYQIDDTNGGRDTATVVINVGPGNAAPVANDDVVDTIVGEAVSFTVLDNDRDPDGDPLSVSLISQPENGSVVLDGTDLTYTPDGGFAGIDRFQYQIDDGQGGTDTATVTISVAAVLSAATGRIETGLDGHGAGSFNAVFLSLMGLLGLVRFRRRKLS